MRLFAVSWLVTLAVTGAAFAQPENSSTLPTGQQMLAHRLEQMASQSLLTDNENVHPWQTTRALILLDHATQLDPENAERWRLKAEALELAGREDELVHALQTYLRLRPDDDVAQLQLIRLLADRLQTADLRLAFFTKIVESENAKHFTKPLRSRVAYGAAMLQREQGRMDEYARLLALALSLDQTNKRAAAESFQALVNDPKSNLSVQAAALFTLFNADPIDPTAHAAVADMLFSLGRYTQAISWYDSAAELQTLRGGTLGVVVAHSWAMAFWGSADTAAALQLLARLDPAPPPAPAPDPAAGSHSPAPPPAADTPPPASPPTQPTPDDGLNPPTETLMLRTLILSTGGDPDAPGLDDNFARLLRRLNSMRDNAPHDPAPLVSLIWAHLLTGRQPDSVAPLIDQLAATGADESLLLLLRGWLALRSNLPDQAQTLLAPLANDDQRAALGLAYAMQQQADAEQAMKLFQQVAQNTPNDVFGLLAVSQLRRASQTPAQPPQAQSVADLFNKIPPSRRNMTRNPLQYLQLTVQPVNLRHNLSQPILLNISLRNVSEFPVGLGPAATLAPRVFLLPTVSINSQPTSPPSPIVVDLRRRLRLDPLQSISVTMRLDTGDVSQILDASSTAYAQIDLTAILNPRLSQGGRFTPGLLGSSVQVRNIVRRSAAINPQTVDAKLAEFVSPDPAVAMEAMKLLLPNAAALPVEASDVRDRIVSTINGAFGRLPTEIVQAWALSYAIDNRPDAPQPLYHALLDQAASSPSQLVWIVLLATIADRVDSPCLLAALQRPTDDLVKQFAQATLLNIQWIDDLQAKAAAEAPPTDTATSPPPPDAPQPTPPADLTPTPEPPSSQQPQP